MASNVVFDVIAKDRASNTFDKVGRSTDRTSSSFRKLGSIAKWGGLAVAAAGALAAKSLFDMTQAAIADEAAQKTLALALRNNTKATDEQVAAVEDWIAAQGKALGVADDELRPALARLVTATKDVEEAQRLAALAMDVSAGTGKSLQTVTEALMKAQNGSLTGLSRLGVATKDVDGKTKSLNEITKELATTYSGQASEAAETTSGKFKRLQVQFDETKEAVGARLLPIVNRFGGFVLDTLIPAVQRLSNWLRDHLGPAFKRVGQFIRDDVVPAARDFLKWYRDEIHPFLARAMRPVLQAISAAFRDVTKTVQDNKTEIRALKNACADLTEVFARMMPFLTKSWPAAFRAMGAAVSAQILTISRMVELLNSAVRAVQTLSAAISKIPKPNINLPDLNPFRTSAYGLSGGGGGGFVSASSGPVYMTPVIVQVDGRTLYESMQQLYRTSGGTLGVA